MLCCYLSLLLLLLCVLIFCSSVLVYLKLCCCLLFSIIRSLHSPFFLFVFRISNHLCKCSFPLSLTLSSLLPTLPTYFLASSIVAYFWFLGASRKPLLLLLLLLLLCSIPPLESWCLSSCPHYFYTITLVGGFPVCLSPLLSFIVAIVLSCSSFYLPFFFNSSSYNTYSPSFSFPSSSSLLLAEINSIPSHTHAVIYRLALFSAPFLSSSSTLVRTKGERASNRGESIGLLPLSSAHFSLLPTTVAHTHTHTHSHTHPYRETYK